MAFLFVLGMMLLTVGLTGCKYFKPVDGQKEMTVELAGADKDGITVITDGGEEKTFPLADVAQVKLWLDF